MNLKHLQHWLGLAETGSFSRAAEKLHITQSALSRSIQALEDELGGPLIDRNGKRNEITPLGHAVLDRARQIVAAFSDLKQGAAALHRGGLGNLNVGLGSGPGAMLMTPWLVYMARNHPDVQVSVSRGPTELQLQQLRERKLDALVVDVRQVVPTADLLIGPTFDLPAGIICRAGHPLCGKYPHDVPFDALLDYPIASIKLSDEVARMLVSLYGVQANPEAMTTIQCEEIPSLLDVVSQSDAVYVGILGAAAQALERGTLIALPVRPRPLLGAALGIVTLADRTELPIMKVFRDFVTDRLSSTTTWRPK